MCELDADLKEKLKVMTSTKNESTSHVHQSAVNLNNSFKKIMKKAKVKSEDATKHLLDTGYFLVHGLDKETVQGAKTFAPEIYNKAKPYIEAMANAFNNKSKQTGYYMNNAELIAAKIGTRVDDIPAVADLIREMAVDHAMTDEAWAFVAKHKDSSFLDGSMRILNRGREKSKNEIFSNNISSIDDAYLRELHRSGRDIEGNLITDVGRHQGWLTMEFEQGTVGKLLSDEVEIPRGLSGDELYRWAEENNYKITEKGKVRRVATLEERKNLGISNDFADIVTETYKSIADKENERSVTTHILNHIEHDGSLISNTAKEGFSLIEPDLARRLAKGLKNKKLYINDAAKIAIEGKEAERLLGDNKTDKTLRDLTTFYKKKSVVLNIKSTINAWGWTLASVAIEGMTRPDLMMKGLAQGARFESQLRTLKKTLSQSIMDGDRKLENQTRKAIAENPMHKYQKLGLATDLVDGVSSQRTMIHAAFSNYNKQGPMKQAMSQFLMENGTFLGNTLTREFTRADSVGRFATAYIMDKGGEPTAKSAQMANDNYADMSGIPHPLVEKIDKYPIGPFFDWYIRTAPGVARTVKRKPIESIIVFGSLFALSQNQDLDLDGMNPVQTVIDETEDKLKLLGFVDYAKSMQETETMTQGAKVEDQVARNVLSTFLPALWAKVFHDQLFLNDTLKHQGKPEKSLGESLYRGTLQKKKKINMEDRMGYDMRGLTQQIWEDYFANQEDKYERRKYNSY